MSELLRIAAGWTETLPTFTLRAKVNGVWVPIDLSNYDVAMDLIDDKGNAVSVDGTATKLTQSGDTLGQLDYAPGDDDFTPEIVKLRQEYTYWLRWELTHVSTGKVSYVPNGHRDKVLVYL